MLSGTKIINGASLGFVARNLITIRAQGQCLGQILSSQIRMEDASANTDINQLPPTKFLGFNLSLTFLT